MNAVLERIQKLGIVPVVVLDKAEDAEPLAKALCEGGLPVAEVTFRTEAAEESIRVMKQKFPKMLVGAGTVLTTEQVDRAVGAGAEFIVSPGLNPTVVEYCIQKNIPVAPGCSNPSDMECALALGLEVVKFFPAEAAGGLKAIKAMAAPYVNLKFMPFCSKIRCFHRLDIGSCKNGTVPGFLLESEYAVEQIRRFVRFGFALTVNSDVF